MADQKKLSSDIDILIEKYLHLLDQYTTLRSQLNTAQSSIHQNISRANFTAERGIRYGPELYDARMQASRLCRITDPTTAYHTLETFTLHENTDGKGGDVGAQHEGADDVSAGVGSLDLEGGDSKDKPDSNNKLNKKEEEKEEKKEEDKKKNLPHNPLRMFGILTPSSLRTAQKTSQEIVSSLVPAIANLDMQMKGVEIEIRRARKYLLKAGLNQDPSSQNQQSLKKEENLNTIPPEKKGTALTT